MIAMGLDPNDYQQDDYNDPDLAGIGGKLSHVYCRRRRPGRRLVTCQIRRPCYVRRGQANRINPTRAWQRGPTGQSWRQAASLNPPQEKEGTSKGARSSLASAWPYRVGRQVPRQRRDGCHLRHWPRNCLAQTVHVVNEEHRRKRVLRK